MVKHCMFKSCKSDTRYHKEVRFLPFPRWHIRLAQRWFVQSKRQPLNPTSAKMNIKLWMERSKKFGVFVCNKHFPPLVEFDVKWKILHNVKEGESPPGPDTPIIVPYPDDISPAAKQRLDAIRKHQYPILFRLLLTTGEPNRFSMISHIKH